MKIQFNTDKNGRESETIRGSITDIISKKLNGFGEQIIRLEVHLSDENGHKEGVNDKRCLLEARLEGMHPVAVTKVADTEEQAVKGAADKLKTSLTTILGRMRQY
jgi:hypothetical protein